MAEEKLEIIKEASLQNNCPECFNKSLKLTFSQKHTYGKLIHRITKEVVNEMKCTKCGSIIYPVKWTDDIERSFDYYQKTVDPLKASLEFRPLFYILVLLLLALVGTIIYFIVMGIPSF
ncbi:MAG: hypothetical protein E4H26_03540 [Flavobacteriales bacterium]|nr:MAG: hypothetical protein E4H26_03540 [Flavobacteriales bacterium]